MACSFPVARTLLQNVTNPGLLASQIPIAPPAPNLSTPDAKVIVWLAHLTSACTFRSCQNKLDQAAARPTRRSPQFPSPSPHEAPRDFLTLQFIWRLPTPTLQPNKNPQLQKKQTQKMAQQTLGPLWSSSPSLQERGKKLARGPIVGKREQLCFLGNRD